MMSEPVSGGPTYPTWWSNLPRTRGKLDHLVYISIFICISQTNACGHFSFCVQISDIHINTHAKNCEIWRNSLADRACFRKTGPTSPALPYILNYR